MELILVRHAEPVRIVDAEYTSIRRVLASRLDDRSLETLNETAHLRGTNLPA